jgi:predicted DNA-binding ribbon-helix-helix protein
LDESNPAQVHSREFILRKQISRLKGMVANKTMEVDFFRRALQKVGARRRQTIASGAKAFLA